MTLSEQTRFHMCILQSFTALPCLLCCCCCSIPQGLVLSPMPFNVIVASLHSHIRTDAHITIYAYDTCLWTSSTRRELLHRALNTVESYVSGRGFAVSACKSSTMAFSRRSFQKLFLRVAGAQPTFVRHCKYHGVITDAGLTWSKYKRALTSTTTPLRTSSGGSPPPPGAHRTSTSAARTTRSHLGTLR